MQLAGRERERISETTVLYTRGLVMVKRRQERRAIDMVSEPPRIVIMDS